MKPKKRKVAAKAITQSGSKRYSPDMLEPRQGTIREKVIKALFSNLNKPVKVTNLLKVAYGKPNLRKRGALGMVLKGVSVMINQHKIPLKLESKREDGETSYSLHVK